MKIISHVLSDHNKIKLEIHNKEGTEHTQTHGDENIGYRMLNGPSKAPSLKMLVF